jgi:hypothetical protein
MNTPFPGFKNWNDIFDIKTHRAGLKVRQIVAGNGSPAELKKSGETPASF